MPLLVGSRRAAANAADISSFEEFTGKKNVGVLIKHEYIFIYDPFHATVGHGARSAAAHVELAYAVRANAPFEFRVERGGAVQSAGRTAAPKREVCAAAHVCRGFQEVGGAHGSAPARVVRAVDALRGVQQPLVAEPALQVPRRSGRRAGLPEELVSGRDSRVAGRDAHLPAAGSAVGGPPRQRPRSARARSSGDAHDLPRALLGVVGEVGRVGAGVPHQGVRESHDQPGAQFGGGDPTVDAAQSQGAVGPAHDSVARRDERERHQHFPRDGRADGPARRRPRAPARRSHLNSVGKNFLFAPVVKTAMSHNTSSTDQKIDWLHTLIRKSGGATPTLEAQIRSRNDLAYAAVAAPQAQADFLSQVHDALGKDVPIPTRREGEDLLAWKRRVVDALFETYTTLHDNLLSQTHLTGGAAATSQEALTNLKTTVKASLSSCSGFDNTLVGRLQASLQALQDTNNRLRGGDVVDAKTLNETLRTAVDTLNEVAVNIRKQREDAQQTAIESNEHAQRANKLEEALDTSKAQHDEALANAATTARERATAALRTELVAEHERATAALRTELVAQHERATSALRTEHEQATAALRTELENAAREQATATAAQLAATEAKTAVDEEINALNAELTNTRKVNAELQADLNRKHEIFKNDKRNLVNQLQEKRAEITTLKAELGEEREQCHVEDGALTAFNDKLEELKDTLAGGGVLLEGGARMTAQQVLKKATGLVTDAIGIVTTKVSALKGASVEAAQTAASEIARLESALEQAREKAEQARKAVSDKSTELSTAQSEKVEAVLQLSEARKEATAATEAQRKAEAKATEAQRKAEAKATEAQRKAEAANQAAATAQADAEAATTAMNTAKSQATAARTEADEAIAAARADAEKAKAKAEKAEQARDAATKAAEADKAAKVAAITERDAAAAAKEVASTARAEAEATAAAAQRTANAAREEQDIATQAAAACEAAKAEALKKAETDKAAAVAAAEAVATKAAQSAADTKAAQAAAACKAEQEEARNKAKQELENANTRHATELEEARAAAAATEQAAAAATEQAATAAEAAADAAREQAATAAEAAAAAAVKQRELQAQITAATAAQAALKKQIETLQNNLEAAQTQAANADTVEIDDTAWDSFEKALNAYKTALPDNEEELFLKKKN